MLARRLGSLAIASVLLAAAAMPARAGKKDDAFPLLGKKVDVVLTAGLRTDQKGRAEDVPETIEFAPGVLRFSALTKLGVPAEVPCTIERKNDEYWVIEVKHKDASGELKVDADLRKAWLAGAVIWKPKDAKEMNWMLKHEVPELKKK